MSEYWKSTPKYWCKFCQTFVRDSALEKKQHESTPRHQGGIQRSLRELHKGKEREDREKQRAKDEVARLNSIVSGRSSTRAGPSNAGAIPAQHGQAATRAHATADDRKRQVEQLVAMGVAVPDEYRADKPKQGDWTVVSERPIYSKPAGYIKDEDEETKSTAASFGVRKRKLDEDEEEVEQHLANASRKNWGSTLKSYPGAKVEDDDIDALLAGPGATKAYETDEIKREEPEDSVPGLKKEESTGEVTAVPEVGEAPVAVKQEDNSATEAPVVFKKRKGKR